MLRFLLGSFEGGCCLLIGGRGGALLAESRSGSLALELLLGLQQFLFLLLDEHLLRLD
jgi:hypothetical protein